VKDGVNVLFADDQTPHPYASVFRQLRKQGTAIPTNDMWLNDKDGAKSKRILNAMLQMGKLDLNCCSRRTTAHDDRAALPLLAPL